MRENLPSALMRAFVVALLVCRAPGASVRAEAEEPSPGAAKLSAEFNDPLTTLPQLFVQDAYTPSNETMVLIVAAQ